MIEIIGNEKQEEFICDSCGHMTVTEIISLMPEGAEWKEEYIFLCDECMRDMTKVFTNYLREKGRGNE